jgi:hypothetical protein
MSDEQAPARWCTGKDPFDEDGTLFAQIGRRGADVGSDVPIPWSLDGCHFWHYQTPTAENPSLYTPVEGIRSSQCPPFAWMCP